ncbi:DNA-binding protein [Pseudomonas citronellolis]|uniref:helix-turn-helix transcriptional regulator n=1 Tax=Pseudomonas citronellolis TaxID=53408 RepID=UPI002FDAC134
MDFEFTLKFKIDAQTNEQFDEIVERLGAEGCTDALVGTGIPGLLGLDFIREASSAEVAIVSAIKDVQRAIPGASLVEVSPDYVGLSDVASKLSVSRQYMLKLRNKYQGTFPVPAHGGSTLIWHLADILKFLSSSSIMRIAPEEIELATVAEAINAALLANKVFGRQALSHGLPGSLDL